MMRAKRFFDVTPNDPRKDRESFMVNLRKKKRAEIFMVKRKRRCNDEDKENSNYFPELQKLETVERCEVLAEKVLKKTDSVVVSAALKALKNMTLSAWNKKFASILLAPRMLERYEEILRTENPMN